MGNVTEALPEDSQSESQLPNKNTFRILALVHALECQRKEPPNFTAIQKHQRGNLNPAMLGMHLKELISVDYTARSEAGKRVIFQVTGSGKSFVESLPEKWSGLQAAKKRLMF
jgi:predicted transcriptional regulator